MKGTASTILLAIVALAALQAAGAALYLLLLLALVYGMCFHPRKMLALLGLGLLASLIENHGLALLGLLALLAVLKTLAGGGTGDRS